MGSSRREFLKQSILATTGSLLVPNFLRAIEHPNTLKDGDKILLVIQLSGGNDGLNTIIPYTNDIYYKMRPTLGINASKLIKATDTAGFNPALLKLKELYDKGYVTVINNVGYPNPDRSHFRSMDIWHTGSDSASYWGTGWLGRYLDASCKDCYASHYALELDDTLSLALKGKNIKGMSLRNPQRLYKAAREPFLNSIHNNNTLSEISDPALNYMYKTMAETISSSDYIYEKSKIQKSAAMYPNNEFGRRLKTTAELILSGVGARVYYVSLSGFDTHINQVNQHDRLLNTYAEGIHSFVADLEKNNLFDNVLIMTFSEFGRRVKQNASGGTDHGTANNVFFIGKDLKQNGFINDLPDLANLDEEDLIYQVDFRNIYATILKRWLQASDEMILQGNFKTMNFI